MPTITTSAGAIFYLKRGRSGPALVCLHGAGGTHAHWGYQLRDLSEVAQVYTIDLPGHGRSAPPGHTTIAGYSIAICDLMEALGLGRSALLGHSMGGAIALQVALDAPDRVAGLGLVGSGGRLHVAPAILDGLAHDRLATIRRIVDYCYARATPTPVRRLAEQVYVACDPQVYRDDFLACDAFDVVARLPALGCPTVIVCGAEDQMTPPKYSEVLRDRIPGAALTLVPSAGHMALIEQPAAVSAALRELVALL